MPDAAVVNRASAVGGSDAIADLNPEAAVAPADVASPLPYPAPLADAALAAAPEPAGPGASGGLQRYLGRLSAVSCPKGSKRELAKTLAISAKPVPLQMLNPSRRKVGALDYVGGFHLTSPDARFGGLSGLDVLENGDLLAVSDQGDFVWIDLGADGFTPTSARLAPMLDASGDPLRGKAAGDAEGLAIQGDMSLVSFERDHRVLAYDVGACGSAARGAPIVTGGFGRQLPEAFAAAGIIAGENAGAEPLAVTEDWYLFAGLETKADGAGPLSARPIEAEAEFDLRVGAGAPDFVGLDLLEAAGGGVRAFSLHRGGDQLLGAAIIVSESVFSRDMDQANLPARITGGTSERLRYRFSITRERRLAEMGVLLTIDNFEGIAAKQLDDGRVRLFIVSDNNFSARQRTLLMVFDLSASSCPSC
ncbi:MAG: esterase-like activity of phytase family protein [Alphaproteobacteria bacterium]|nr:esterase-like activity of phytase family protein [Alphaproteobacteria bacterium]